MSEKRYHEIADETLESLTVTFEELVDTGKCDAEFDIMYSVRKIRFAKVDESSIDRSIG